MMHPDCNEVKTVRPMGIPVGFIIVMGFGFIASAVFLFNW